MWQEGQEDKDLFDDVPESFILCALHQGVNFVFFLYLNYFFFVQQKLFVNDGNFGRVQYRLMLV